MQHVQGLAASRTHDLHGDIGFLLVDRVFGYEHCMERAQASTPFKPSSHVA